MYYIATINYANALIECGKVDSKLIAIEGGSAGGFTALSCLCFTNIFRVGACRYAVSNLIEMQNTTHRFEAGYLEYLLGPLEKFENTYKLRSPLFHADNITCPVIFFQGLKDKVVFPEQTFSMVEAMWRNQIPVEVHTFPTEGHGFRDSKIKVQVLKLTERFFAHHLGI